MAGGAADLRGGNDGVKGAGSGIDISAANSAPCTQADTAPLAATVLSADSIPHPKRRVTDLTGALSSVCKADLTRRLAAREQQIGDVSIEQYATQIFEQWKLGQKKTENGILLVAALHVHHVRIEVGYGIEGTIPDVIAGRIIRKSIVPAFRENNFEAGIGAAVDSRTQRLTAPEQTGASTPDATADERTASPDANTADARTVCPI